MPTIGQFGTGPYGTGTMGGVALPDYRLLSAESVNPFTVLLTFNAPYNPSFPPAFLPSNYTIPGLSIKRVVPHPSNPAALYVYTTVQSYQLYEVTVGEMFSDDNRPLDFLYGRAPFTGWSTVPCFRATAVGKRRVRLQFEEPMEANSNLENPAGYTVRNVAGAYLTVQSVRLEQTENVLSVVLSLATDMVTTNWYRVDVSALVRTTGGLSLNPRTTSFQWVDRPLSVDVGVNEFSGEVSGGLLGTPLGQVFFSPALEAPIANSAIMVEEVSVCTEAFDTYEWPEAIDPRAFFLWDGPVTQTLLDEPGVVLWAAFPRLMEARIELTDSREEEAIRLPSLSQAAISIDAHFDPSYISYLNNVYWELFPASPDHAVFIVANTLGPIPIIPADVAFIEASFMGEGGVRGELAAA